MPKSKTKRKKPKKQRRSGDRPASATGQLSDSLVAPSTNGYHLKPQPSFIGGISDRSEGLFHVASTMPFFLCSWISAGLQIKDVLLFTLFFGSIVVSSISASVRLKRDTIPFPEQLELLLGAALAVIAVWSYAETDNLLVFEVVAGGGVIRLLASLIEVRSVRTLFLILAAHIVGTALVAPLGGFLGQREMYFPFAIFGVVPGCILASALVVKYSPLLKEHGWKRVRVVQKKNGERVLPGAMTKLFSLLLILGPVVPVSLAAFRIVPQAFSLTILSLSRIPVTAEGFMKEEVPDSRTYFRLILTALASELLMLIAAFF